jgi:hypothetical protein
MIDIQVLCRKDPSALAELIARTMQDAAVVDRAPEDAHLTVLLAAEELEQVRATYLRVEPAERPLDADNDWSAV